MSEEFTGEKYLVMITKPETGEFLLSIKADGSIHAPSIEAASEAGKVFIESMRETIKSLRTETFVINGGQETHTA